MSCIIGSYNANYHTNKVDYNHAMGIKPGGNILILGGCGPMGMGAAEYPLALDKKPARIVVTDISNERIARASKLVSPEYAKKQGVELIYVNPLELEDQYVYLMELTQSKGYDDVFIYAPIKELAELGDRLMAFDGCLNVFAGPSNSDFTAEINLYNCHYTSTHIIGTTGGNTNDLKEALALSSQGKIHPAVMVTHIGGINCIAEATAKLPNIPVGKILAYTQIDMPLTSLTDLEELGKKNSLFAKLHESCEKHNGMWNVDAEKLLLGHFCKGGI